MQAPTLRLEVSAVREVRGNGRARESIVAGSRASACHHPKGFPIDYRLANDAALVDAMASGRDGALSELYDRYHRRCFSMALRILAAESDAEEAVQETFLRVWRSASRYDPSRAVVSSWLLSITHNLCLDEIRRRKRSPQLIEYGGFDPPSADHPDEEVERAILGDLVRAALHSLVGDQRKAIELVYFHGLSSHEVGQLLDVPPPTVRSRLRLGLLKLNAILKTRGVVAGD